MNILFLALSFSTNDHVSFYEDLLREFKSHGHNIFVACANEKRSQETDGIFDNNGITVLRIRTGNITGNVPLIKKGISTLQIDSLFLKAVKREFGNIKFDLIMYPTPPITLVNTIAAMKKKTGAGTYLLLKDIFPQNAVDLGMMTTEGPKKILYQYFRKKEEKLYRISDFIGCMSPANCDYVIKHNPGIQPQKVEVCPNCLRVEDPPIVDSNSNREFRLKYNIPKDATVFLYGGNLGKPQGIDFYVECLKKEINNKKAFFITVGSGSEKEKIEHYIKEQHPSNAILLDYLPKDEYQRIADQCDVGMIFLDYRFTIPNFPSRILAYLVSAKPVLVATDVVSDMGRIAEKNGFGKWCESNDVNAFSQTVAFFEHADLQKMGKNGWEYFRNNYSLKNGYEIVMKHF